jgi:hypothetical protein
MAVCPNFSFVPSGVSPPVSAAPELEPGEAAPAAADAAPLVAADVVACELLLDPEAHAASAPVRTHVTTATSPDLGLGRPPGPPLLMIFSPNDIPAP